MQPNVCLYTKDLFVCLVAYFNFFFSLSFPFFKSQEFMFWHKMEVFWLVGFCFFLFLSNATMSLTLNFECLKVCLGMVFFSSLLSSFPSFLGFSFSEMIQRFAGDVLCLFMVMAKGNSDASLRGHQSTPLRVYGLKKKIHENIQDWSSKQTPKSRATDMNFFCILIWFKFAFEFC